MPYTSPPAYFETTVSPASTHAATKEWVTFLNGQHASQSNAIPWACIDCFDGTTREQPAGGDMSNLSAGNLWREDQGTPPQDAWAVFQAPAGGDVANRYQLYVEMTTFTAAFFGIFMLDDWAVGAGTDSNPDIPATSLGVPPFAGGMDGTIANHTDYIWISILDEGSIWLIAQPTVAGLPEILYFGDLKPDNPAADDSRPFVVSRNPDASGFNDITLHVSVQDDSTIIDANDVVEQGNAMVDSDAQDAFTREALCQASCYANEAGDRYWKGKFRLCAAITRHARTATHTERVSAGIGPADFDYQVIGRGGTSAAQIVIKYPLSAPLDRHIQIVGPTIPDTLEP